jgi:hypothetical protein
MMKTTRALLLLSLFALAAVGLQACGASEPGYGSTGSAGTSGSAGTGGGAAGTGAVCQVDIQPVAPLSFTGLVPGASSIMRVRGVVTGAVPAYDAWHWTVSLADGSEVPVTQVGREQPALVEFTMTTPGTYTIAVQLTSSMPCMGLRTVTAAKPGARVVTYRLHVTPPATDQVPEQDLERQVMGGTPSGGNALAMSAGIQVPIDLRRSATGVPLSAYVRLTETGTGAVVETRTPADGPTKVRVAPGTYDMLIVPDGDVAPTLIQGQSPSTLGSAPISMTDGVLVGGSVVNAAGKPLAGATVVLRSGGLMSTTGKTDANGAFQVRARGGTFGLTVVSALAAGGLESKLDGGILVNPEAATPSLAIKIQSDPLVSGVVSLEGQPASITTAARVTLSAAEPLMNVATIAVGGAAPQPMKSDVHLTLHPDGAGAVSTGALPRGKYKMTVFPALATNMDGVTTTTLDLTAGDLAPTILSLEQKVMMKGRLGPKEATGVRVFALDDTGLPVVAEDDADATGVFQIPVSRNRSYALHALPRPFQPLARASFPHVAVAADNVVVQDHTMPPALLYSGRVVDPFLQGLGTALVQAFCEASGPGCTDPTVPVAETVTRTDGTFELMLPDPDGTP